MHELNVPLDRLQMNNVLTFPDYYSINILPDELKKYAFEIVSYFIVFSIDFCDDVVYLIKMNELFSEIGTEVIVAISIWKIRTKQVHENTKKLQILAGMSTREQKK